MPDRIRIRRPWLGVLAPAGAFLFSSALVWASGHDPVPAVVATPSGSPAPTSTTTADSALLDHEVAEQEADLARLSADVRALRASIARRTRGGTTTSGAATTQPPASQAPRPATTTPPATRRTAQPAAPTPTTAPARPTRTAPPPPAPTPHVTTRSS